MFFLNQTQKKTRKKQKKTKHQNKKSKRPTCKSLKVLVIIIQMNSLYYVWLIDSICYKRFRLAKKLEICYKLILRTFFSIL